MSFAGSRTKVSMFGVQEKSRGRREERLEWLDYCRAWGL